MAFTFFRSALCAIAVVAASAPGAAQPHASHGARPPALYKIGSLVIENLWSRATPGGAKVAGGYMRITNAGAAPDRLIAGTTPLAGRFELHEMSMQGDVMRMRPLEKGLEIPPGKTVELKPGGSHAMFLDLKQPLRAGDTFNGTLTFEKAGTVSVNYAVRAIGSTGGAEGHHH